MPILFLFCATHTFAQNSCDCPKGESRVNKTFSIRGTTLGLCGFLETGYTEIKDTIYTEAYIFDCGNNKIVYEWWALQNCAVKQINDTVKVIEYYLLTTGDNMGYEWKPFFITNIYSFKGDYKKQQYYLLDQYNYSQIQINTVLDIYRKTTAQTYDWNSLNYLKICYQLFWSYVSGCEQALTYLIDAEKKFGGLSGHVAEEHSDLLRTCKKIKEYKQKES